jgi:hypothetical protein
MNRSNSDSNSDSDFDSVHQRNQVVLRMKEREMNQQQQLLLRLRERESNRQNQQNQENPHNFMDQLNPQNPLRQLRQLIQQNPQNPINQMKQHTLSYGYLDNLMHIHASPWNFRFIARDRDDRDTKIRRLIDMIFQRATVEPVLNHEQKSKDMTLSFPTHWETLIAPRKDEIIQSLIEKGHWVYNQYDEYYVIGFAIDSKQFEVWSKGCEEKMIKWKG